jgi:hypothetical protein
MDQASEHELSTGQMDKDGCLTCGYAVCRCAETIFTGRYDNEPRLQMWLRKAHQLRQACIAIGHKDKELSYNASRNILTCEGCGLEMDLNPLVDKELRVPRVA